MSPTPSPPAAAKKTVKPIPDGYSRVSPYLVATDAARVIDFLKTVVGAKEGDRMTGSDGKVQHAEVRIGESVIMLSEGCEKQAAMPTMLHVYVEDVDATYAKAIAWGATPVRPPADQFYGDRSGGVKDHSGNQWWFATHKEDLTLDEIRKRAQAAHKG